MFGRALRFVCPTAFCLNVSRGMVVALSMPNGVLAGYCGLLRISQTNFVGHLQ